MKVTAGACVVALAAVLATAVAGCQRTRSDQASAPATSSTTMAGTATPAPSSVAGSSGGSDTAGTSSSSSGTSGSKTAASAGAVIDDSLITTKVKAALLADTEVKGTDIKVETKQGEVQLSGFVRSQAQVDKALKVAQGIEGVKKVDNKMTVKP